MVMKNAKNRPPKFRENSHIGNVESDSRILGDAATASPEHGSYQIAVDGKNATKEIPIPQDQGCSEQHE
ncbi:hypothetical protein, partial [Fortiea contorta]|uniref:hypothetical protein n=1 Tax=Fortiea contorta TaxID=1892405 RepID=UPI001EE66F7D